MFSIMAGILASVLPNLTFVWRCFRPGTGVPQTILRGFYLAEVLKFAMLALLMVLFLQLPRLNVPVFFSAFVLSEITRLFYQFFILARTTAE